MITSWNTSSDPEYLHVRELIRKILTSITPRRYFEGMMTEDMKDDVQDAFEVYLTKVITDERIETGEVTEDLVLYWRLVDMVRERNRLDKTQFRGPGSRKEKYQSIRTRPT